MSLRPKRPFGSLLLCLGLGLLLWWAVIQPIVCLVQAERIALDPKLSAEKQKDAFLQIFRLVGKAARSPLLRPRAQERAAFLLREHLNPSRWYRMIGLHLQKGSLHARQAFFSDSLDFLAKIEAALDPAGLRLDYLRAWIALEVGAWDELQSWSKEWLQQPLHTPQDLLALIWSGHALFFSARPSEAKTRYEKALAAAQTKPAWQRPTRRNWRLAGEIQALRYHLGLIALSEGDPKGAASHFRGLSNVLEDIHKKPKHRPLWMASRLWAAIAHLRAGQGEEAKADVRESLRFSADRTLPQMAAATWFQPADQGLLEVLAQSQRENLFSYADSPLIAKAHLADHALASGKMEDHLRGFQHLRSIEAAFSKRQVIPHPSFLSTPGHFSIAYLPLPATTFDRLIERVSSFLSPFLPLAPASLPTSLPTSWPAFPRSSASQGASGPSVGGAMPGTIQALALFLRFQRALLSVKISAWEDADERLKQIEAQVGFPWEATFLRAMIAVERRDLPLAKRLLLRTMEIAQEASLPLWLAGVCLAQGEVEEAKRALALIPSEGRPSWADAIRMIRRGLALQKTDLPRDRKAGFWLFTLGQGGRLGRTDRSLVKQARVWGASKALEGLHDLEGWLSLLQISHQREAFHIPDLLSRYRLLHDLLLAQKPSRAKEYLRRWAWFAALYQQNPEAAPLLDRMAYTLRWGALGLRLQ